MTPESLSQLHYWDYQMNFLILPAMGWSILAVALNRYGFPRLRIGADLVMLAWLAWVDWRVALAAFSLFLLGCLVWEAFKDDSLDRMVGDALSDRSHWTNVWRKSIDTPIFLSIFIVMMIWMPHAWALPLAGLLIGVPVFVALLVISVAFRAGVLATLGVLTVLGLCHGVLHLVH